MSVLRIRIFSTVLLILAGASVRQAAAQEETQTQPPLSPRELVRLVAANGGYAFEAAAADIDIALARLDKAQTNLRYRVTVKADAKLMESLYKSEPERADLYAQLELVQPLYDFGRTSNLMKAAESDIAAAEERLRMARNAVLLEGLALFFDLHVSELRVHALNQDHAHAYVRWDRAQQRQKLGKADSVEVAERQALVEKTRLAYYQERSKNRALRLRLKDLTGRRFYGELIDTPKPPMKSPAEIDPESLARLAVRQNPQIAALEHQAQALGFKWQSEQNRPRLDAYAAAGQSNRELRSRDELAAGLRLSWSLVDGGITKAERARLSAEQRRILAEQEALRRKLDYQVQKALLTRSDSWQQVVAAKSNLEAAKKRLTKRRRLYDQDRVADLGRALIEATFAEAQLARATGAYYFDNARLATLLGESPATGLREGFLTRILIRGGK